MFYEIKVTKQVIFYPKIISSQTLDLFINNNVTNQFVPYNFVIFNFQPNHSMLYVTPLKAYIVDCTEVSQSFNDIGITGMKVCISMKSNVLYFPRYVND